MSEGEEGWVGGWVGALFGTKQKESVLPEGTDPMHDPGECLLNQNQEDCGKNGV